MNRILENVYPKYPVVFKKSTASMSDDTLRQLAFDNSLQPNIITLPGRNGKIIIANNAACKLLGYSKEELLTKCRGDIFDINESSYRRMLKQRTDEGHSTALVTAISKKRSPIPCEITSAVFMDEEGNVIAITTIADMSQSILKQKNIDTRKEKIVADNIILAKSEQKEIDTKNEKMVSDNIVLARSEQKAIDNKKEKTVSDNIILAQAKSDEEKLCQETATREKLLLEYRENFKLIFNSSSDVLFDSDLLTNEVTISDAYEKEFGYKITANMATAAELFNNIHPDDREAVMEDYLRMQASEDTEWNYHFRILRVDGTVANVLSSGIVLRNAEGMAYRRIGSIKDISKQNVLEEKLEHEVRLKEKQIAEAMEEAKDTERSDIGKELHDNVNQLLGASKLYLEMARQGGADSKMYLSRSSEYTLNAIEEIRKLTRGLTTDIINNLGLAEAIDKVAQDTMELSPVKISCALGYFKEHSVNDKFKLNVFRIVQEQLNNILKHADAKNVRINLSQNKQLIRLIISDNGNGYDTGKKRIGIGIDNIKSRAATYNGTADFVSQPGQGCALTVIFPFADVVLNKN